jgi:predicted flap endonuclease-1-like 5' DNA nuclease
MPWGAGTTGPRTAAPAEKPAAEKAASHPAPAAAPVAEAVAQPVAFVAAPVPAAEPAAPEKAAPKAKAAPKPKAAKPAGPERLTAARKGKADDLKEIEGIGPAMEKLVNSLGFYHYDQIASWSDADVELVDAEMKTFKGRIVRDKWVAQAKIIVSEGLEAFRERAKTNNY